MAERLTPTAVVARSPRLAGRLFEERMLLITPKDSMLHRLDEVGSFIWQQLEAPQEIGTIIDAVSAHFDGFGKKENAGEIMSFLLELESKGLIEITNK